MAGSEYYDDRFCVHGNNVGYYGDGCKKCEEETLTRHKDALIHKMRHNHALTYTSKIERVLQLVHPLDWTDLEFGVKTKSGWVRLR